jgi:plastocyanin
MKRTIECIKNVFNPDAAGSASPFVLNVGDTVVWNNQGDGTHNCVSTGKPTLPQDVPDFDVGATSIEIGPFAQATGPQGIPYTCTHHAGMDGIIVVV